MANLTQKSPCADLLPFALPGCQLTEAMPDPVTAIAPYPGRKAEVHAALAGMGLGFPQPNSWIGAADGPACLWSGREQAFLVGVRAPDLADIAALTDQSDGWAVIRIAGPLALAALARLCPLDLRPVAFGDRAATRAQIGHMPAVLRRLDAEAFEIWVFRSMAATAVHELTEAIRAVAARA